MPQGKSPTTIQKIERTRQRLKEYRETRKRKKEDRIRQEQERSRLQRLEEAKRAKDTVTTLKREIQTHITNMLVNYKSIYPGAKPSDMKTRTDAAKKALSNAILKKDNVLRRNLRFNIDRHYVMFDERYEAAMERVKEAYIALIDLAKQHWHDQFFHAKLAYKRMRNTNLTGDVVSRTIRWQQLALEKLRILEQEFLTLWLMGKIRQKDKLTVSDEDLRATFMSDIPQVALRM